MSKVESYIREWERGQAWLRNFTRDFPDLDNLADGVGLSNVKGAPKVGDVRLANAVRQIPRNSIQQMPTFGAVVNGTKLSIDAIVGSFLLRSVVFNEDTFGTGVLQTMQMSGESALTRGFQALMAGTGKLYNQFGTTLKMVHYDDLVIEPGVFDASDSSYFMVRTRVTPGKLRGVIKAAKQNPNTKWNVPALEKLLEMGPQDYNYNTFLSTPRSNPGMGENKQFDIITRYGVGPYYDICIYSPQLSEDGDELMEYQSKSKFGFPRVAFLVIDPAPLLPFGISRARLASPWSNYATIYLQSTAKMQLLNADPPVFRRGMFTSATPLRRGVEWTSQDPSAEVRLMELGNSTLQQFEQVMGFAGTQIESVMGVGDAADVPNSAYQNTAAIQARQQLRSLSSAQVTAIMESATRQYALTALDMYISEQTGDTPLVIDDEAKNAINRLEPGFVGDDNIVNINWEQYYERIHTLSVTIDLSMGKSQLADKKRADLQDMHTNLLQQAGNDPVARAQANAIGKELIQETLPEVAAATEDMPAPMPAVGGEVMPQGQ